MRTTDFGVRLMPLPVKCGDCPRPCDVYENDYPLCRHCWKRRDYGLPKHKEERSGAGARTPARAGSTPQDGPYPAR